MFTSDVNFDDLSADTTMNGSKGNVRNYAQWDIKPNLGNVSVKDGKPSFKAPTAEQESKAKTIQIFKYLKIGLVLAFLWVVATKVPFIRKRLPKFMK